MILINSLGRNFELIIPPKYVGPLLHKRILGSFLRLFHFRMAEVGCKIRGRDEGAEALG